MKKLFLASLTIASLFSFSQNDLFASLKTRLKIEHPELVIENKLLVLNVWTANDKKSREANVQTNKAYIAYEWAKLKGGAKGMIGISVNLDTDGNMENIVLEKDKVTKIIVMKKENLDLEGIRNIIFDSAGNIVVKNTNEDIFEEIHKLITR